MPNIAPYNRILALHKEGLSNSAIAKEVGCARGTVIDILKRAEQQQLVYPQDPELTDIELHRLLHPSARRLNCLTPDYGPALFRLGFAKNNSRTLWAEYKKHCDQMGCDALPRASYQNELQKYAQQYSSTHSDILRMKMLKGEIIPGKSCSIIYAELDHSGFCSAIVLSDHKPRTWIDACRKILDSIGRLPARIVFAGRIPKAFVDETENFVDYYYNFNKPLTFEKNSSFGTAFLLACAEHSPYYHYATDVVRAACDAINSTPLYPISSFNRLDAFLIQRSTLQPLPLYHYETVETRHPVVQMNFHVELDGKYYSVPHKHLHETVEVEIYDRSIEIFFNDHTFCRHERLKPEGAMYSTIPDHMPKSDKEIPFGEKSGTYFRSWAKHIGSNTYKAIDLILKRSSFEPQAYNACQTVLMFSQKYGNDRLDAVCANALQCVNERLNVKWISRSIKQEATS